jgi:16S rRNA (guanine527-N7)-methyltransferase
MTTPTWDPIDELSDEQREKISAYESLLERFNRRVNLVSPESAERIRTEHVRHSLSLTRRAFPDGVAIVDWGTGGGLPAIPMAIAFPEVTVYAVDSVGKKVRAVRTFARRLELENVFAWNGRAEDWTGRAHYSISRATAPLADLWSWHTRVVEPVEEHGTSTWPPGVICLKGGDLTSEIQNLHRTAHSVAVVEEELYPMLGDDHFREKKIVTVTSSDM